MNFVNFFGIFRGFYEKFKKFTQLSQKIHAKFYKKHPILPLQSLPNLAKNLPKKAIICVNFLWISNKKQQKINKNQGQNLFCYAIIIINVLVFLAFDENFGILNAVFWDFDGDLRRVFALNVEFIDSLYLWQPLTTMFLHANFTHLALNMIVLWQFGTILERLIGTLRLGTLYILGGISCSILSGIFIYFQSYSEGVFINIVGASGAICVLMGFYAYLDRRAALGLFVGLLLMSFLPMFMGINIAWYAHIFGFLCGYVLAKIRIFK